MPFDTLSGDESWESDENSIGRGMLYFLFIHPDAFVIEVIRNLGICKIGAHLLHTGPPSLSSQPQDRAKQPL